MKTSSKQNVVLPVGTVIVRRTITLGMGHAAEITITADGPAQPLPETGAEWPVDSDYPAAILTITLPTDVGSAGCGKYMLHHDLAMSRLSSDLKAAMVAGERMYAYEYYCGWGGRLDQVGRISREVRLAGASLRGVAADLLRDILAELRPVHAHLRARAARIAAREATLLAGSDMPAARPVKQ